MIDVLRWVLLAVGLMCVAGFGAFIAAAIALASRADDEQERALRSSTPR